MSMQRRLMMVLIATAGLWLAGPVVAQRYDDMPPDDVERPREEKKIDPKDIRYVVIEVTEQGKPTQYQVKYEHEWEEEYRQYVQQLRQEQESYRESLKTWRDQDGDDRNERPKRPRSARKKRVARFPDAQRAVAYARKRQEIANKRHQAYLKLHPPKDERTERPDDPALYDQPDQGEAPRKTVPPKDRRYVVVEMKKRDEPTRYKVMYQDEFEQERREKLRAYQEQYDQYREQLKERRRDSEDGQERPKAPDSSDIPKKIGPTFRDPKDAIEYARNRQDIANKRWQVKQRRNPRRDRDDVPEPGPEPMPY